MRGLLRVASAIDALMEWLGRMLGATVPLHQT